MRDPATGVHKVDGTVADHLIGDVDAPMTRVLRPWGVVRIVSGGAGARRDALAASSVRTIVDRGNETVATPVCRFDVARPLGIVAKRLPNLTHAGLQRGVADEDVRPQIVEQLSLGH